MQSQHQSKVKSCAIRKSTLRFSSIWESGQVCVCVTWHDDVTLISPSHVSHVLLVGRWSRSLYPLPCECVLHSACCFSKRERMGESSLASQTLSMPQCWLLPISACGGSEDMTNSRSTLWLFIWSDSSLQSFFACRYWEVISAEEWKESGLRD